jgi:hypothetical protein
MGGIHLLLPKKSQGNLGIMGLTFLSALAATKQPYSAPTVLLQGFCTRSETILQLPTLTWVPVYSVIQTLPNARPAVTILESGP